MAKGMDMVANIAAIKVVESAANTQTSAKFAFPFSIMDKTAIIISRIEYWITDLGALNSTTDSITAALTVAGTVTDITNQADPTIVDTMRVERFDLGAAASGLLWGMPSVKDFANLPGGGLMVAPAPLYGMLQGNGNAAAMTLWLKLFYTYKSLTADQYWELVESRRIISN